MLCVAALLAMPADSYAQAVTVAQLSGTVVDESGAALPGVEVTATQTDTGMTRFVVTGMAGDYVFTNLPVGPYKLTAKLSGFSTFEQTGIVLAVGDTRSVNVKLSVGGLTETVQVQADANLVETRNVNVGVVIPQEQIVSLPLNGRSALQLILLSGAAVEQPNLTDDRQYPNSVAISVAGGTGNSTMYLVDGGYNNDPQNNTGNPMPFPDALQEFKTENGVRNARYGMSTGATVNAVTRAGTNVLHGTVFDFARHHTFNAIRFFEREENGGLGRDDGLKRNQVGGTIGGPIMRDKLFFFGGTQITNTRIAPLANDVFVPTAEVRNGDFRRIMSAACRGSNRTLGAPFVNNQIDPALYHPISLRIMDMLPVPTDDIDPDGCGRYVLQVPNDSDEQQYIGRLDYQLNPNHRVFGRVFYTHFDHKPLFDPQNPNLLLASGNGRGNRSTMATVASGYDWIVSPTLVATTRVNLQRTATLRYHAEGAPTWTSLGVNTFQYTTGGGQDFMAAGTAGWGGMGFTGEFFVLTPSISQDFDWIKGAHSFSFGAQWTRPRTDGDGTFQSNGNVQFTGLFTSGTGNANGGLNMADFVLGQVNRFRQGGSQINDQSIHALGLYFGDVWKVRQNITLNLGVRWEPYLAAKDANGYNTAFVRENFDRGIRSSVYPNAPVGLLFSGDPGFPDNGSNNNNRYLQFAPRAGIVWDPKGNNEQTIRAGIGHYYDSPKLWHYAHHMLNPPFGNTVDALAPTSCGIPNRNGCATSFSDPWANTPGGDPLKAINYPRQGEAVSLPQRDVTFPERGVYVSTPVEVTPMQVTQWNVSYQRQFAGRFMADVTYMGNRTTNIWIGYEENPVIYIPGNCQAGEYGLTAPGPCSNRTADNMQARSLLNLLNPAEGKYYAFNDVAQTYDEGRGWYHGVKFSVQKRMSDGLSINANYTYSECTNEGEPGTDIGNAFPVPIQDITSSQPQPDTSTNKGPCINDRPHIFNLSSVVQTAGWGPGFLKTLSKDWQIGIIWQARSGIPITPSTTGDLGLTGLPQRPFIVQGVDPYVPDSEREIGRAGSGFAIPYVNLAAFAPNTPGTWGDTPKGYLRGPGYKNVDMSFSRNIMLGGARRLELRVEAFNIFDIENWANPTVQIGSSNATNGRITNTVGDPRIMQFAVKYAF
jgi:hypothetical protein